MAQVRRCAVLGSPIGHSLSPVLHRAAYAALDLGWSYDAVEVTEEGLPGFLDGLGTEWRGLSLTMPLKRTVVPLVDEVLPQAARAGGGNTVLLDGGRRLLDNTDVPGAAAALRERYDGPVGSALVLGGGATAASVLLALADLGCREATLAVRDPARAEETLAAVARHPGGLEVRVVRLTDPLPEADVLVSTVPAAAQEDALLERLPRTAVVFEVLYDPWPTPLARWAGATGRVLVGGLDLLVHQAVLQVAAMTGQVVDVAVLRRAGEEALAAREARAQ
ncbi:MAG: shikimate dehydrogenase [Nocardioides sp.]|nr:shikimate dehydrogenase [Nocardioides sp.]